MFKARYGVCSRCGTEMIGRDALWDQEITDRKAIMHFECRWKAPLPKMAFINNDPPPTEVIADTVRYLIFPDKSCSSSLWKLTRGVHSPGMDAYIQELNRRKRLKLEGVPIDTVIPNWHSMKPGEQEFALYEYSADHNLHVQTFEEAMNGK